MGSQSLPLDLTHNLDDTNEKALGFARAFVRTHPMVNFRFARNTLKKRTGPHDECNPLDFDSYTAPLVTKQTRSSNAI